MKYDPGEGYVLEDEHSKIAICCPIVFLSSAVLGFNRAVMKVARLEMHSAFLKKILQNLFLYLGNMYFTSTQQAN